LWLSHRSVPDAQINLATHRDSIPFKRAPSTLR
jgi:hypothetical protein